MLKKYFSFLKSNFAKHVNSEMNNENNTELCETKKYIKSEIKSVFAIDEDTDLDKYQPIESDNFGIVLDLEVGIEGEIGADIFYITVCTPKWLEENYKKEDLVLGLHFIIVFEYNFERLNNELQRLFCIEGEDWDEISKKLSYFGAWEFQDYKEYTDD